MPSFLAPTFVALRDGDAYQSLTHRQTVIARDRVRVSYCCPTAAKPSERTSGPLYFLWDLQVKKRADERTRTAYPCSSYE